MTASASNRRSVVVGGAAYAAVTIGQRALAFLLLPLYARVLSPAEYGELGILLATTQAFTFVMGMGQQFAVYRLWFQLEGDLSERQRYLGTVGLMLLVLPAALAVCLVPAMLTVGADALEVDAGALVGATFGTALFVSATVLPFTVLRIQERFVDFVWLNLVNAVVTTVATLLGLLVFDLGVAAWVLGYGVGAAGTLVVAVVVMPWPWQKRVVTKHVQETLKLGVPVLPHQFSLWALQLASRVVLLGLVTKAQVGLYTMGFVLAQPIMLLGTAVNQAVMPSYGRASKDEGELGELSRLTTHQVVFVVVITVAGALIAPAVIAVVLPPDYLAAIDVIPWLCLANALYVIYAIPMNEVSIFAGKAQYVWIVSMAAAALNIGLLYVFVPADGIVGASFAAVVGSCGLVVGISIYGRIMVRGPRVEYEWLRIFSAVAIGIAIYGVAMITTGDETWLDLALRVAWCLPLLACAWPAGLDPKQVVTWARGRRARLGSES